MHVALRLNKELTLYNKRNISDRLLSITKGEMIVCYNRFNGMYEVHDSRSFKLDPDRNTLQVSFQNTLRLNQWLIREIKSMDFRKYQFDVQDEREYLENLHERESEASMERMLNSSMKTMEHYLGGKI